MNLRSSAPNSLLNKLCSIWFRFTYVFCCTRELWFSISRFIFIILIFITHSLVTVQILTVQNTHRFWKYSKQTKDQLFVSFTNEVKMGFFHINTIAVFWLNFDFQAYENVYSGCVETVIIFFVSYRLFVWFLLTLINCTRKGKKR